MKTVMLPDGEPVPILGQGTWRMGEEPSRRAEEVAALRLGLDLGMWLIDTAEMYGEGGAEEVVGEAVAGRRDAVFLVSKAYPYNATREGVIAACERSLRRLGTDRIDLYLLHWRGAVPLAETIAGFEELVDDGKIRHWGVSNFDIGDMTELWDLPGGPAAATDQVLYNPCRREAEWSLLPWLRQRSVPLMAYTPLEPALRGRNRTLEAVARRHGATPVQIVLAWLLAQPGVIAIPKAARLEHLRENRQALDLTLTAEDIAELDRAFPPPRSAKPLETL